MGLCLLVAASGCTALKSASDLRDSGVDLTGAVDFGPEVDLGMAADLGPDVDLGPLDDLGPIDLGDADLGPPRCAPRPVGDTAWAQYPLPGTPGHPRVYEVRPGGTTVIDCVTGLEWQRDFDSTSIGLLGRIESVQYCIELNYGGYDDWRLPSTIELMTLVNYEIAGPGPTIDATAFPGTPGDLFWTSSPAAGEPSRGWRVAFANGLIKDSDDSLVARVRCVR